MMWLLKLKLKHKGCVFTERTKKYNVTDMGYALGHYKKGRYYYFMAMHILSGDTENKRRFLAGVKKDKRIEKIEVVSDLYFTLTKSRDLYFYPAACNPALIFPSPIINHSDGFEYWEIACFDRKPLQDFINEWQRNKEICSEFEILSFKKTKLKDVFIPQLLPALSDKQKHTIEFAAKHGYYDYPRRVKLEKLAKALGMSKSTFHEHLRRAEKKLMRFLVERA